MMMMIGLMNYDDDDDDGLDLIEDLNYVGEEEDSSICFSEEEKQLAGPV